MGEPRVASGPRGRDLVRGAFRAAAFLPGYFQALAREHGDVVRIEAGPVRAFLLNGPEHAQALLVDQDHLFQKGRAERRFTRRLLGEGVLGSEGDFHSRQHALLFPVLHGSALDPYARAVTDGGLRMQSPWVEGESVDVFSLLARTTTEIMIESLFGVLVEQADGRELALALADTVDALEHAPLPFLPGTDRLPLPANRRFDRARRRLDRLILREVRERRLSPGHHASLLASLVRARYPRGGTMRDRQARDEALSIFRGHKTAGTALSWAWYLLARHPDVEATVLEEIDSALGGREPTFDDLPRLPLCRRVVDEGMRLFPPAWMLARRAMEDVDIGGFAIPAGSTAITSAFVIHRDARCHPEPRRFDPDRFLPERRAGWHPFAYFPVGGGPKMCLGDEFAPFEAVLLMATIGSRWRLRLDPSHRVAPAPGATLQPRGGLHMIVERR